METKSDWKRTVYRCVRTAALRKPEITADDVWSEFDKLETKPAAQNKSAIGSVLVEALKDGILKRKDGFSLPSQRPSTHGRLLRVFRSEIYSPAQIGIIGEVA